MKNRLAWTVASLLMFGALTLSIAALQGATGWWSTGTAPAAPAAPAAGGQRGTGAPAAGQPGGVPGQGARGGPRTPDGALAPNAPHPDPLPIDLFTSKNFYKDKALWTDPKYYRCNISRILTEVWADNRMGANPPSTAGWGDCSRDIPVAEIKSPYPYKTAKEHYEALMAAATKKGGRQYIRARHSRIGMGSTPAGQCPRRNGSGEMPNPARWSHYSLRNISNAWSRARITKL
jgi:hypothetical protein